LLSGCKVFKSSKSKSNLSQNEAASESKVFSVPETRPIQEESNKTESNNDTTGKPVSVRSENFTFSTEDQATYGSKKFFVIVGSFSSNENANRLKKELSGQGFKPIILRSETGYYRVCIDSYDQESEARFRVMRIRQEHPKYADSWLLIKK
jgi:cell division protein FtsN